jgi:uroporphyrinogen-III decarboxylase
MNWADFDLAPWADDIKARENRMRMAASFREPDRIPVAFSIAGSYYCGLFGVDIRDYYNNPELQVEVQMKGLRWQYEELRADSCTGTSIGYECGPIQEAVVFGAFIERLPGTSPRIAHMFNNLDDAIAGLNFPAPEQNERLKREIQKSLVFQETAKKAGVRLKVDLLNTVALHPPLSCLCALMDPGVVYAAMIEEPEKLKTALDLCFKAFISYTDIWLGKAPVWGVYLADDNSCFISANSFREFEMPYYRKIVEHYQPKEFHLHTDGPSDQLFPVLPEAGVTNIDIGGFSRLENAVKHMKGRVYLHGGLNCKDFYGDGPMSPETRKKALTAMRLAGPGGGFQLAIGGETYVGTSPQGICDLVRLVEVRGKYPLDISPVEIS